MSRRPLRHGINRNEPAHCQRYAYRQRLASLPLRRNRACWSQPSGAGATCRQTGRVRDEPARPSQWENVGAHAVAMARAYSGATTSCGPQARGFSGKEGGLAFAVLRTDRGPGRGRLQRSGRRRTLALADLPSAFRLLSVGISGRDDAPSPAGSKLWPPSLCCCMHAAARLPRSATS